MPAFLSYPGVYIEEVPSGVRTITGVATSVTAFLGRTRLGPVDEPVLVNSFADFERQFGGLGVAYPLSYSVRDFYLNGGSQAIIVRLYKDPATPADKSSTLTLDTLTLAASSPGEWGRGLRAAIDVEVPAEMRTRLGLSATDALFNLTVRHGETTERFLNLTVTDNARRIDRVLKDASRLVQWKGPWPATVPAMPLTAAAKTSLDDLNAALQAATPVPATIAAAQADYATKRADLDDAVTKKERDLAAARAVSPPVPANIAAAETALAAAKDAMKGDNGAFLDAAAFEGSRNDKRGLYALEKADLFNLLCIPPDKREEDVPSAFYQTAMAYCRERRAMLIVDSPAAWSANKDTAAANAKAGLAALGLSGEAARNAALYFPRVLQADPLRNSQVDTFVPCGIIAGVMARTDTSRGVWKAPAGLDAAINGIQGLNVTLNDAENGMLNPLGINCLRAFPVNGRVVWGARTLRGADQLADEYKYVPVRRTALFIEESLYRGTQWVVFEPNDEPLWAQIRLNIGAFMQNLFRQGAFQGKTPRDAYFVKCDRETTTQTDINLGIVNIVVGFAPLKPAEFVVIKIQQIAGDIPT
jgi:phage tail sheath protein FI